MFSITIGETLRKLRKQARKTQAEFAAEFGIGQRRWSRFECGKASPRPEEMALLRARLGSLPGSAEPKRIYRHFSENGKRHRVASKLFLSPADRNSRIRYRAARTKYPEFVARTTAAIQRRSDYRYCDALCSRLALGSAEETLLVLSLLEAGALPSMIVPSSLGALPHPVVDPRTYEEVSHRKFVGLSFEGDFYFFQVSFKLSSVFTVDILRWSGHWSVIEMDGSGHDFHGDDERSAQLAMPVRRVTPSEVLAVGLLGSSTSRAA